MDLDTIREHLPAAVPFVAHTGLEYERIAAGTATVVLPDRPETKNHLGTQHAGALFTAGESASGAAFTAAFATRLGDLRPVVADASIAFTAPARGRIRATAELPRPASELLSQIEADGRTRFDVDVRLSDESGHPVATMTVTWHVSSRTRDA